MDVSGRDAKGSEELVGGEGGIRTPDTVARMPHFECGAFNHSATSPRGEKRSSGPAVFSGGGSWKQAIRQGGASRVSQLAPDNALTVRARACDRANTGRRHVARWQSTTGPTAAHIRSRA